MFARSELFVSATSISSFQSPSICNSLQVHQACQRTAQDRFTPSFAVSTSRTKPDIDAVCTKLTQAAPSVDSSYYWCNEDIKAPDETPIATLWARVPYSRSAASCELVHWCDVDNVSGLLQFMGDDIFDQVVQEVGRRYRIGKLLWESGDERGEQYAYAYMHTRTNEDCEDDGERVEDRHIWWDIDHVDLPAS